MFFQALPDAFREIEALLQRIEDIIVLHGDIVEDVEAGFPKKKKVKEEVKTPSKADVCCSLKTNGVDGSVVDLCCDSDLE